MTAALITLGVSGVLMGVFVMVSAIEDRRGRRFFEALRARLDTVVVWFKTHITRMARRLHLNTLMGVLHYLAHALLARLLQIMHWFEKKIEQAIMRNRSAARALRQHKNTDSHLSAIAEHKQATALSESDKQRLKEEQGKW